MTLMTLGKFLVPKGIFGKDFQRLVKPQSQSKSSQGDLEHCLPIMVTKFKLSKATSASPFMALHSIWRLVFSFVTFWISTMDVYMLVCIYYVFLERVGIKLFNYYPVSAWFSVRRLDRHEMLDMESWDTGCSIMIEPGFNMIEQHSQSSH
jgi:hypothetical protein